MTEEIKLIILNLIQDFDLAHRFSFFWASKSCFTR